MRAHEITISSAQIFTFGLSMMRASARHPCAVCETELVCGFAAASSYGASVRLPFPAQTLVAVVKSPPAATSLNYLPIEVCLYGITPPPRPLPHSQLIILTMNLSKSSALVGDRLPPLPLFFSWNQMQATLKKVVFCYGATFKSHVSSGEPAVVALQI